MARFRPWLLFATASVSFASCILNPGPELPNEGVSDVSGASGASAQGGASGVSTGGAGANVPTGGSGGASAGTGGTTIIQDAGDGDADGGPNEPGGAGGDVGMDDAGPDASDAG